ncbi:unnamed protein product, partial [Hapterophycus canaliculatus]
PRDLYPKGSKVAKLSEAKFPKKGSAHVWLVHFYSPQSHECSQLSPTMEKLAELLLGIAKVGAMDCTGNAERFCVHQGVREFPGVMLVVDGKATPFEGNADAKSLHAFVLEGLPAEHVANLRRRDQADKFLQSECQEGSAWGVCGVLFTEKFETSSALKALSFRYRDRVS